MAELAIAIVPLCLLLGFALVAMYVPLVWLAGAALGLMALGFVAGVPSGLAYHVLLRRALLHRGALARGWYWAPQKHHAALDEHAQRRLRPWFLVGALGFGLIVLGFLLAVAALLLWFRAQKQVLALGMGVWRITISLAIVLVLINVLAWYVGKRAAWALALPRWAQRALGIVFLLGIVSAFLARTLGAEYAALAEPLGAFGGAVVLGIGMSSVLLVPVELGRFLAGAVRRVRARLARAPEAADTAAAVVVPARREFIAQVAASGALGVGMGAAAYGTLFGRREYTIEHVPIKLAKLPRALDGLTIVQLSDIHVGTFVGERELRAAERLVREAKPDVVVMTGDLLDHDAHYAPLLGRFARSLEGAARFGVFAVPGNHDHYAGARTMMRHLREAGVEVLLNRHMQVGGPGASIVLAGLDDVAGPGFGSAGPDLARTFAGAPPELARVLLSHNPAYFPTSRGHADLTLSGHTHGGQISLFINTAALVLRHGLVRGHYTVDGSQLYVNRGFGTAGPPARIGSPPEVTRLVLTV